MWKIEFVMCSGSTIIRTWVSDVIFNSQEKALETARTVIKNLWKGDYKIYYKISQKNA